MSEAREYTYKGTSYGGDSNYTTSSASNTSSNRHVKWSEDNYEVEIEPEPSPLPDPDLDKGKKFRLNYSLILFMTSKP